MPRGRSCPGAQVEEHRPSVAVEGPIGDDVEDRRDSAPQETDEVLPVPSPEPRPRPIHAGVLESATVAGA